MRRLMFLLVALSACTASVEEDLDPAGTPDDTTDDGPPADDPGDQMTTPDPQEPPETINGVPLFQVPFPCGQVWAGQTRTNHSPAPSVDFNRLDDDGDPVVAAASGVVARVENLGSSSYGRWIEINHGNGYRTRYAHLSAQLVAVGQTVKRGQQIGNVGTTGGSTGPHLHYEQRHNNVTERASFNGVMALYYGSKNYTSQNACNVAGVVGRVNTGGAVLTVYADSTTASASVSSVANGATVTITCQKIGQSVSGTYGTSTLWDKIGTGFVPDAYVSTGSDGQVAPTCP
ncbi:MAG TPA: peptidoglycan DD-metalloendopeptidase family protein [Kofleriaceae bacterium]|nr:peptidoglycan DD-metalloendopeptidase family protein [Kofleriaceae bacterium]